MKRVLLLIAVLFSVAITSAQTTKFYGVPDVEVKVKRCVASAGTAYIDLVFTNWTNKDVSAIFWDQERIVGFTHYFTAAYDDEGNVYKMNSNLKITVGGEDTWNRLKLPREIPVKIRVYLSKFDEYAQKINMLKIAFRNMSPVDPYGVACLEVRNIPVTRQ